VPFLKEFKLKKSVNLWQKKTLGMFYGQSYYKMFVNSKKISEFKRKTSCLIRAKNILEQKNRGL
jgi:hypothetical protein